MRLRLPAPTNKKIGSGSTTLENYRGGDGRIGAVAAGGAPGAAAEEGDFRTVNSGMYRYGGGGADGNRIILH